MRNNVLGQNDSLLSPRGKRKSQIIYVNVLNIHS